MRYKYPLLSGGGVIPGFSVTQGKAEAILLAKRKHWGNWEHATQSGCLAMNDPYEMQPLDGLRLPRCACALGVGKAGAASHLS